MIALCERVFTVLGEMSTLLPDSPMEYALEPEEAEMLKTAVEIARKAGQVKGSRMTWVHREDWFVFRNTPLGVSASMVDNRPKWAVMPPKKKFVSLYVPEEHAEAMRLFLGSLVNA